MVMSSQPLASFLAMMCWGRGHRLCGASWVSSTVASWFAYGVLHDVSLACSWLTLRYQPNLFLVPVMPAQLAHSSVHGASLAHSW